MNSVDRGTPPLPEQCDCRRDDDWHYAKCRTLHVGVLDHTYTADNGIHLYKNRPTETTTHPVT